MTVELIEPRRGFTSRRPTAILRSGAARGSPSSAARSASTPIGQLVGEDHYSQAEQAFRNVATAVEAVGGSMESILKITIFVVDHRPQLLEPLMNARARLSATTGRRARTSAFRRWPGRGCWSRSRRSPSLTSAGARKLALALPEAVEQDHHGRPSFRVNGKIFATLWDEGHMNVMLDEGGIVEAVQRDPEVVLGGALGQAPGRRAGRPGPCGRRVARPDARGSVGVRANRRR